MLRSRHTAAKAGLRSESGSRRVVLAMVALALAAQMANAQSPACGSTVVSNNFNRYAGPFRPWTADEAQCGALPSVGTSIVWGPSQTCTSPSFLLCSKTLALDKHITVPLHCWFGDLYIVLLRGSK